MLDKMHEGSMIVNVISYTVIISAYETQRTVGGLEQAMALLHKMFTIRMNPTVISFSTANSVEGRCVQNGTATGEKSTADERLDNLYDVAQRSHTC